VGFKLPLEDIAYLGVVGAVVGICHGIRAYKMGYAFANVRGGDKVFHWSGGDLQSRRSKIQPVVRRSFVLWTKGRRRDVCRGGLRGGSAICFQ